MGEINAERVQPDPPPVDRIILSEQGCKYLEVILDPTDDTIQVELPEGSFYAWSDDEGGRMTIDEIIQTFQDAKDALKEISNG